MKKTPRIPVLAVVLAAAGFCASAQEPVVHTSETLHYVVESEVSAAHAAETAARMEAMLSFFNSYLRFDLNELPAKLRVTVFSSKKNFNSYLQSLTSQVRDDYVYLHYRTPERCRLLAFMGSSGLDESSFMRQGFVQVLKAFIASPPLWLREGFAVYLENSRYDPVSARVVFRENLTWLETLKALIRSPEKLIALDRMLSIDIDEARESIDVFYPEAWAMVTFLAGAGERRYERALWDSIRLLSPAAPLEENVRRIMSQAFGWIDQNAVVESFVSYFNSRKSFRELVESGAGLFASKKFDDAEKMMLEAVSLEPERYLPYYYLGLISYERRDYPMAEYYYRTSAQMGCHEGLINYALGVNAFAAGNADTARQYLVKAKDERSGEYRVRALELLTELNR
jgi:tetratricopeptide (TPR) repeat protein